MHYTFFFGSTYYVWREWEWWFFCSYHLSYTIMNTKSGVQDKLRLETRWYYLVTFLSFFFLFHLLLLFRDTKHCHFHHCTTIGPRCMWFCSFFFTNILTRFYRFQNWIVFCWQLHHLPPWCGDLQAQDNKHEGQRTRQGRENQQGRATYMMAAARNTMGL